MGIEIFGNGIIVVGHGSKTKLKIEATSKIKNPRILKSRSGKFSFFI